MMESNTGAYYCIKCGTWAKVENNSTEPKKTEPSENTVGSIEVSLDEKTYEPFMRELKNPDSLFMKAVSQARNETEVRKAIAEAITRLRNDAIVYAPGATLAATQPAIASTTDNKPNTQSSLKPYPNLVPSATVANQQTKRASEIRRKEAQAATAIAEAKKAEEAKDEAAVQKVIMAISDGINESIQAGLFMTTARVTIEELNYKAQNYYKVKEYFVHLGYQVGSSQRMGKEFYINVSWKTALN